MSTDGTERSATGDAAVILVYEPNPKHKPVPSPGKHGSICPREANGLELLQSSDLVGAKRFSTDGVDAFCARQHRENRWHGYPVSWEEVPPGVVAAWVAEGRIDRRAIRRSKRRQGR